MSVGFEERVERNRGPIACMLFVVDVALQGAEKALMYTSAFLWENPNP